MDPEELLDLFHRLVVETVVELGGLDDWGPSGLRPTQYRHDVVADRVIAGGLRAAGLAVLSEESGLAGVGEVTGEGGGGGVGTPVTVVVDPVDGSTNASRGVPWYAASLCAVDRDGPLAALVVNLATGDRYRAIRDRGARFDRTDLRVGAGLLPSGGLGVAGSPFEEAVAIGPSGCWRLGDAIVGFSGHPPIRAGWHQFRVLGAAALDLCAVADGTLDGYIDLDRAHGVWDYLGALLVCREAGVEVVDWGGEELVVFDPDVRRGPVAGATPALTERLASLAADWC